MYIGYWPDCVPPRTCHQEGKIGTYPNCHATVVVHTCAAHMTGTYPDCHWLPCPNEYLSKTGNILFQGYLISQNDARTLMIRLN